MDELKGRRNDHLVEPLFAGLGHRTEEDTPEGSRARHGLSEWWLVALLGVGVLAATVWAIA